MKTFINNIKLILSLQKQYGVPIRVAPYRSTSCALMTGRKYDAKRGWHIRFTRILLGFKDLFNSSLVWILYHELGHHHSPYGRVEHHIVAELAAWEWAVKNCPTDLTKEAWGAIHAAMCSYWGSEDDKDIRLFASLHMSYLLHKYALGAKDIDSIRDTPAYQRGHEKYKLARALSQGDSSYGIRSA